MKSLEKISNVCVVGACILFLVLVVKSHFFSPSSGTQSIPTTASLAGKKMDIVGCSPDGAASSLILVLSTTCPYCDQSMAFYRELTGAKGRLRSAFRVIAVFSRNAADGEAYLRRNGLDADCVVSDPLPVLGRFLTPTLLIADGEGKVKRAWRGVLSEANQREVLMVLGSTES